MIQHPVFPRFVVFLAAVGCTLAIAQTAPLPPGVISNVHELSNNGQCPGDFFSDATIPAVCYKATVTCADANGVAVTAPLDFYYSQDAPLAPVKATIVIFGGGGGETPSSEIGQESSFAQYYFNNHYQLVQVAWQTDWENVNDPTGGTSYPPSPLTSACRPAGFLKYVHDNLLTATGTPMCTQASSAGSGAVAYSLVWYGDGAGGYLNNYVKNAELNSGPVFGDIEVGCKVPPAGTDPVPVRICGSGQFGCSSGTTSWLSGPQYIGHYATQVRSWTGQQSCANGTPTTSDVNQKWKAMSIVNGGGGSFQYSNTSLAGWLCTSSQTGTCTTECPNNSAAEGEQFYNQFTGITQTTAYKLTGIVQCNGAENVGAGGDPDSGYNGVLGTGKQAIQDHMLAHCQ